MKKMNKKEKLKLTLTLLGALSGYEAAVAAAQYSLPYGSSIETTSENFESNSFTIEEEKTSIIYHYEVYGPAPIGIDGEEYPNILMYPDYTSNVPMNDEFYDLKYIEYIKTKETKPKMTLINKRNH